MSSARKGNGTLMACVLLCLLSYLKYFKNPLVFTVSMAKCLRKDPEILQTPIEGLMTSTSTSLEPSDVGRVLRVLDGANRVFVD
jgi:hypothetical protein